MKHILTITGLTACLLTLGGCQSLHGKHDPQALYHACLREADMLYQNRSYSTQAETLYQKAVQNCRKKAKACQSKLSSKMCQRFIFRYEAQ